MGIQKSFGRSLQLARKKKGLTQEDFTMASSVNFISLAENGKTSPTLQKLESICSTLNTHPVTLIAFAYMLEDPALSIDDFLDVIRSELIDLTGA